MLPLAAFGPMVPCRVRCQVLLLETAALYSPKTWAVKE